MSSGVIYLSPRDLIAYIVSLRRYDIIDYMVSLREVIHIGVGSGYSKLGSNQLLEIWSFVCVNN